MIRILLLKAHVRGYSRQGPGGRVILVKPHDRHERHIRAIAAAQKRFEAAGEAARGGLLRSARAGRERAEVGRAYAKQAEAADAMRDAVHAMHAAGVEPDSPHAKLVAAGMAAFGAPGEFRGTIDPEGFLEAFRAFRASTERAPAKG